MSLPTHYRDGSRWLERAAAEARAKKHPHPTPALYPGTIKDVNKIMYSAVHPAGATNSLHSPSVLDRLERAGYVEVMYEFDDHTSYRATDKGREAWARGKIRLRR
jgi:hypothetical protein